MADAPTLTRRCCVSQRDLQPGEKFVSLLVEEAGRVERRDYAADAWPGAPAGAVAFWSGKVPAVSSPRRPILDDELLWDCFTRLADAIEPGPVAFRYIIALLLMRRKRLKFEDSRKDDAGELLVVRDSRTGERVDVRDPGLTEEAARDVQAEVERVLGGA